jgi:hypothetical protein
MKVRVLVQRAIFSARDSGFCVGALARRRIERSQAVVTLARESIAARAGRGLEPPLP